MQIHSESSVFCINVPSTQLNRALGVLATEFDRDPLVYCDIDGNRRTK